jgi:hypothetical protein
VFVRCQDEEGQEGITNGEVRVTEAFLLVTESARLGNKMPGKWNVAAGKQEDEVKVRFFLCR